MCIRNGVVCAPCIDKASACKTPFRNDPVSFHSEYTAIKTVHFVDKHSVLYSVPHYRYGGKWTESEYNAILGKRTAQEFYQWDDQSGIVRSKVFHLSGTNHVGTNRSKSIQYIPFKLADQPRATLFVVKDLFTSNIFDTYIRRWHDAPVQLWDDLKLLNVGQKKKDKHTKRFYEYFDPTSVHISKIRLHINFNRSWLICLGHKTSTYPSKYPLNAMWGQELEQAEFQTLALDCAHIAQQLGINVNPLTFYKKDNDPFGRLVCNSIGYRNGGFILGHKDIHIDKPNLKEGFDPQLIVNGCIQVKQFQDRPGIGCLGFSSVTRVPQYGALSILKQAGDAIFMTPPWTTNWFHFVPSVISDLIVSFQLRRWIG
eukprot:280207_1